MKYLFAFTLLFFASCTSSHRLMLVYESGDAASHSSSKIILTTEGEDDETS